MWQVLTHDILPVFVMPALGFALGRAGAFSAAEARAVNRVAFLLLQPALIFPLISGLDTAALDLRAVGLYLACEAAGFALAFWVARRLFRRGLRESLLLAMAVVFVNSLLYVWPISYLIYGEAAALPITAIVALDASVTFAVFILAMELTTPGGTMRQGLRRSAGNPVLLAIVLGAAINLAGLAVPEPLLTAAAFAGAGAAPLTLFALGVILSGQPLRPTAVVAAMSGLKLVVFPALVLAVLTWAAVPPEWRALLVLNAAGPSGAMAFALALLYGVRTDAVAPVIIWTGALSLFSLAWLA